MINIFNTLNTVQEIKIRDRDNTYYSAFIESRKSVELEPYQMTDDIRSKIASGSLILLGSVVPKKSSVVVDTVKLDLVSEPLQEDVKDEDVSELDVSEDVEEVAEETAPEEEEEVVSVTAEEVVFENTEKPSDGVYKCKICGNEYASMKGLSMHMSRTHANK